MKVGLHLNKTISRKSYIYFLIISKDFLNFKQILIISFSINSAGPSMNRTSAHCNQAIMFITDGIEGEYAGKATFDKHNKKKRVRVFSYLVGRIKNPAKEALIKMSCDNHGHFYKIETLGNIWDLSLIHI